MCVFWWQLILISSKTIQDETNCPLCWHPSPFNCRERKSLSSQGEMNTDCHVCTACLLLETWRIQASPTQMWTSAQRRSDPMTTCSLALHMGLWIFCLSAQGLSWEALTTTLDSCRTCRRNCLSLEGSSTGACALQNGWATSPFREDTNQFHSQESHPAHSCWNYSTLLTAFPVWKLRWARVGSVYFFL